jgi:hypothetical protein
MAVREYTPERFVASVPRHEAPANAMTGDSTDWQFDPAEHKTFRRAGQTTPTNWDSVLFSSWSGNKPRGRQITGMRSSQLSDKSQHPTALFTDDDLSSDHRGEVVTYDSDNSDWYSIGGEYSTTHYPATGFGLTTAADGSDKTSLHYRWTPMWTNGTATARYVRGITQADRQLIFAGGRAVMESGEWLYGMSEATPWMWRKTWNFATGSGTNINRLRPWMHQVPLFWPTATATTGTASVRGWRKDRVFYYSVAFMAEDGSIGPFTPVSDTVCNAMTDGTRGRYTIPNASNYYTYISYTNIPRGPKGTIGRVLARTAQVDTASGFQPTFPGVTDLRIVTIIRNNTQTTFDDYDGNDETLVATPDIVRIDHKAPLRGKYLVANDSRFLMCGALKPNPAAILIAPTGITAARDINAFGTAYTSNKPTDDPDNQRTDEYQASAIGSRGFYIASSGGTLYLRYWDGAAAAGSNISLTSAGNYITLQALCDIINETLVSTACKEWAAQLAPGVDGDTLCSNLAATVSSTAAGDDSRAGTAAVGTTADRFFIRGPWEPGVLYFTKAYLDTLNTDDQAIEFTRGGPSDTPAAILNWSASGETRRKPGDGFVGRCLGAAPLGKKFAVFYERGVYWLEPNDQLSYADENLRLHPVVIGNIHVVSDTSIFWGDGYVGCMTHQGVFVLDDTGYKIISEDVWKWERQAGEWSNEINRSLKAMQNNGRTSAPDESLLYAAVLGDQIHVSYRKTSANLGANDRRMVYDYSTQEEASGVAALLRDGQPFGWSCPLTNTVGAMCEIADASGGMVRYGIVENTAAGRIDKFDTGTVDQVSTAIVPVGYLPTDFCDTSKLKAAKQVGAIHKKAASGLAVVFARDQGSAPTAHSADTYSLALASTGTALYARTVKDLSPEARTPADVFELKLTDDGTSSAPEVWRLWINYDETDFPR